MEVYYKDLISEDASLEKLVDDLTRLVQGADDFVAEAAAGLETRQQHEIATRLDRLKEGCRRVRKHAAASALAADKVLREYPYAAASLGFACGLLTGALIRRSSR